MESPSFNWTGFSNKCLKPQIVFLILALTTGLGMVFVNAPFQSPDEGPHFWRAYHVSQGDWTSSRKGNAVGGEIPESVIFLPFTYDYLSGHPEVRVDREAFFADLKRPFDLNKKRFHDFFYQGFYAPIVYLPQAAGILLGRIAEWSALKLMYAGRVSNLLCWIAIIFVAIRIVPVFKWVFVLVALLPRTLTLSASLSADGPTNAIAMLMMAVILRKIFGNEAKLNNWDVFLIITLSVLLSMAKQVYLPLVGLVLLIPVGKFNGWSNKLIFCGTVIGAAVLAMFLWSMNIREFYRPWAGANAPEQMKFVMSRPWEFPIIAFETFLKNWVSMRLGIVGVLGYVDVWLPAWIYRSFPFVMCGVALFDISCEKPFGWPQRCWIIMLCTCTFLLIYLSMYLTWTVPGASAVTGVQSRYFLPLLVPMMVALLYNQRLKLRLGYWGPLAVGLYLCVVWTVTCSTVWARFYGPV